MLENTHTKMELYQEQPQKYALSTEASTSSTTFLTAQKRASHVMETHLGPVFFNAFISHVQSISTGLNVRQNQQNISWERKAILDKQKTLLKRKLTLSCKAPSTILYLF